MPEDFIINDEIQIYRTNILEVEDKSIIVGINGWRVRFYYDLPEETLKEIRANKRQFEGRSIELEYIGDLNNVFTLKRLPIIEWF